MSLPRAHNFGIGLVPFAHHRTVGLVAVANYVSIDRVFVPHHIVVGLVAVANQVSVHPVFATNGGFLILHTTPSLVRRLGQQNAGTSPLFHGPVLIRAGLLSTSTFKLQRILDANFQPNFSLDLALKDLELLGADAGTETAPIAADIASRWRQLVDNGASGLDVSAAAMGLTTSLGASK